MIINKNLSVKYYEIIVKILYLYHCSRRTPNIKLRFLGWVGAHPPSLSSFLRSGIHVRALSVSLLLGFFGYWAIHMGAY